jgi:hypothetical protein
MKKIKVKDIILNHYQKVHELELHGVTVRVWKPRTMQQLPAYNMLDVIDGYAEEARCALRDDDKAYWAYGNPDWGMWDALLVRYVNPKHKTLDIYFAAILVRPFSREAYEWYNDHHIGLEQIERLMLMWDSREFDRSGGFDQSYGRPANMDEWENTLYHVVDEKNDIEDMSPDFYHENEQKNDGLVVKLRDKDGNIDIETSWPKAKLKDYVPFVRDQLADCFESFDAFRKKHPEFHEMHFMTDQTVWEKDMDEEVGE